MYANPSKTGLLVSKVSSVQIAVYLSMGDVNAAIESGQWCWGEDTQTRQKKPFVYCVFTFLEDWIIDDIYIFWSKLYLILSFKAPTKQN